VDRIEPTLQAGHPDEPRYAPRPADDIVRGSDTRPRHPSDWDGPRRNSRAVALGLVALVLVIGSAWLVTLRPSSDAVGGPVPSLTASPSPRSPRECGPGDLTATFLHSWQPAARLSVWIRLEMLAATTCTVYGEPRVSVLSANGRLLLESRPAGSPKVDGVESQWAFPPGAQAGGWIDGANWCGDAGPPSYQLVIDQGPWRSDVLELDQLPPCIKASEPAWIQDVQTSDQMVVPLPTVDAVDPVCRGVGVEGALAGDPTDTRLAWMERPDGTRTDLVWPAGYRASFTGAGLTDLAILDPRLTVVLRVGDPITGGCVTPDPNVLLVVPSSGSAPPH